ncbi:Wzz/FepE/Etk N-terminal domain-containing protein [Pseudomonas plecoglossicida]|uniref:Wzz/FepE/Etk N-terminal domain-containing protein n=1 Tax=Pseudomonas plecoglossicida TaxID=70775 RepID=UPI00280AD3F0|nr:Wzz/FepE/Etk N-terminal domain-containing protein [Pseudomonas plecoglossicida]
MVILNPSIRQSALNSVTRVPPAIPNSETDLFDLVRRLWRRRVLILGVAAVSAALGVVYAQLATPVYETSTILRPVALNELDALNRSQIYTLPPVEALKRVGATLDSYDARLAFFRARPELIEAFASPGQSLEQAFDAFNSDALMLMQPDPKKTDLLSTYIGLKIRYDRGLDGASVLNDFVAYAAERERAQLVQDLQIIKANRLTEVDAQLSSAMEQYSAGKESRIARLEEADAIKRAELNDELSALRVQSKLRREARLAQLDEAIAIARSLGLSRPSTPSLMANADSESSNVIRTEVNSQQTPLYFLGSNVLEAERNALRRRTSDDFTEPRIAQIRKELVMLSTNRKVQMLKARANDAAFLEGIETLRAEKSRLLNLDTSLQGLRLISVDQLAVEPVRPIRPRKALIVLVALVVGLMLGVFVALIRSLVKDRLRQIRVLEIKGTAERVSPDAVAETGTSRLDSPATNGAAT